MKSDSLFFRLGANGIRPKKGLGQNFLVDPAYRERIVAAAALTPNDTVLEVGPGPGLLTDLIAEQGSRVVAVELDDRLIPLLHERYVQRPNVTIVHADILKVDVGALMVEAGDRKLEAAADRRGASDLRYKVVANLPYYITAAVIRHLLETEPPPELLVLTVQREVAERMVAGPPRMSLLALGVQFYCTAQIVVRIPAGAFYPTPKVDSAVVRLARREQPVTPGLAAAAFFRVARAGFSQPRKQLRNSLAAGLGLAPPEAERWLSGAGIDPRRRAETLTLEEWGALAQAWR